MPRVLLSGALFARVGGEGRGGDSLLRVRVALSRVAPQCRFAPCCVTAMQWGPALLYVVLSVLAVGAIV